MTTIVYLTTNPNSSMVYNQYDPSAGMLSYLLCGIGKQSFLAQPGMRVFCRSSPQGEARAHAMVNMLAEFIAGISYLYDENHQTLHVGNNTYCIVCSKYVTVEDVVGVPLDNDSLVKAPKLPKSEQNANLEKITDDRFDILSKMSWEYMDRFPEEMKDNIKFVEKEGISKALNKVVDRYKSRVVVGGVAFSAPQDSV